MSQVEFSVKRPWRVHWYAFVFYPNLIRGSSTGSWWRHQMKHFPRYWPFVRGIHRSPVTSPRKGQWRGALMFALIRVWINGWVNSCEAGDLRRYRAHYDVTVMLYDFLGYIYIYGFVQRQSGTGLKASRGKERSRRRCIGFNSLWPSDAIWRFKLWSRLVQVIGCCLNPHCSVLNSIG